MEFKKLKTPVITIIFFLGAFFIWNYLKFKPDSWTIEFENLGSSSSPQAVDLNNDGIKDIVIGAGDKEFVHTDRGVMALNGVDGSLLWKVSSRNQVVGSPLFVDITNDNIPEVIIGGRSALLFCINGATGKVIWEFLPDSDTIDFYNDRRVLNFYNPQLLNDIDGDGWDDLLVSYGGFIKAKPGEGGRPSGYLMILNSVTGKILKKAAMPDGAETYFSPVLYDFNSDGVLEVVFGSGGETLNGHLYITSLTSLLEQDLSNAEVLDSGFGKGFIAPPILSDLTNDGIPEIIVNSVNGRSICFNGDTRSKIWEVSIGDNFEIYTTAAVGNFIGDKSKEVFVSFGKGIWPDINSSINIVINGTNGSIINQDTLGTFQYASPIVVDFNEDGYDDILFSINTGSETGVKMTGFNYLENRLVIFDINNKMNLVFGQPKTGTNIGSTPLLVDLDDDKNLDVIYCYSNDGTDSFSFKKMILERVELNLSPRLVRWPSYMGGANYSSYFK